MSSSVELLWIFSSERVDFTDDVLWEGKQLKVIASY